MLLLKYCISLFPTMSYFNFWFLHISIINIFFAFLFVLSVFVRMWSLKYMHQLSTPSVLRRKATVESVIKGKFC